jgi:hypothetical protein
MSIAIGASSPRATPAAKRIKTSFGGEATNPATASGVVQRGSTD